MRRRRVLYACQRVREMGMPSGSTKTVETAIPPGLVEYWFKVHAGQQHGLGLETKQANLHPTGLAEMLRANETHPKSFMTC